jgi:hypothetical protein
MMRPLFLFLLVSFGTHLASAQVFMRPFDNAAAMSVGGATIAQPGFSMGVANDALLGKGERFGVLAGSALPYGISGWQTAHFQAYTRAGKSSGLALDIAHNGTDAYAEQRFRVQYGRRLSKKLSLGANIGLARAAAPEYSSASAPTFGISVLAQALPTILIGASVQNPIQPTLGAVSLPTVLRMGASWRTSEVFCLLAELEKDIDRPAQVKAGMEYRPAASVLAIRAGVRTGEVARMGFGLGLRLKSGVSVDVASEWHPSLGLTPAAMVAWRR